MAHVDSSRLLPRGAWAKCRMFRRRAWATSWSDEADFCTSEFVWMKSTLWNDQKVFLTTLKIRIYPKTLLFSDEQGSDTNCWWDKPLVVALKHSEEIKLQVWRRLAAYSWWLAATRVVGRWQLVVASGGCLPWPSRLSLLQHNVL